MQRLGFSEILERQRKRGDQSDQDRMQWFDYVNPWFIELAERLNVDAYRLHRKMGAANWSAGVLVSAIDYYGSGWWDAMHRAIAVERARAEAYAAKGAQKSVGPKLFRDLTDDVLMELVPKRLRSVVESYAGDRGVLLVGPTGCGKSVTAVALARKVGRERYLRHGRAVSDCRASQRRNREARRGGGDVHHDPDKRERPDPPWNGVCWRSATSLSLARREHPLGQGEAPVVEQAMAAALLVIDDLGWEPRQDTTCTDVLAYRYDAGLPTIVTSGEVPEVLSDRYGAALIRRITETRGVKGVLANLFPKEESE